MLGCTYRVIGTIESYRRSMHTDFKTYRADKSYSPYRDVIGAPCIRALARTGHLDICRAIIFQIMLARTITNLTIYFSCGCPPHFSAVFVLSFCYSETPTWCESDLSIKHTDVSDQAWHGSMQGLLVTHLTVILSMIRVTVRLKQ